VPAAAEEDQGSLRCLALTACGLTRDDAVALVEAILSGEEYGGAPPLELELADNITLGSDGAAALAPLVAGGSVVALNLDNCGMGQEGAVALGAALASPTCALQSLHIGRNHMGAAGAAAIADGLRRGAGRLRELSMVGRCSLTLA